MVRLTKISVDVKCSSGVYGMDCREGHRDSLQRTVQMVKSGWFLRFLSSLETDLKVASTSPPQT